MPRRPGKRVDYLHLDVDGVMYKVELRACTGVFAEELRLCMDDPPMEIKGTDLAKLKKEAQDFIRENCTVEWERWVAVDINDPSELTSDREHYELEVEWHRFEQGLTSNGKKVHRNVGSYNPKTIHHGWRTEDRALARTTYVRETPEVVAALEEVGRRIEGVRVQLAKLLGPRQIESTASRIMESLARALPGPAGVRGGGA